MRIAYITPSINRDGGGVASAVIQLGNATAEAGAQVRIFAGTTPEEPAGTIGPSVTLETAKVIGPRQFGYCPRLAGLIASYRPDVLHVHGIWMASSFSAVQAGEALPACIRVISPHGMLDPWILNRGKWKKWLALWGYERRHLSRATFFHALNVAEETSISNYCPEAVIHTLGNGVSIPERSEHGAIHSDRKVLLYLGRIHEKKGIEPLLKAWIELQGRSQISDWKLDIVGWGDPAYVQLLIAKFGRASANHEFIGPLFDGEKMVKLRSSTALILPSFSEGQPLVPLEAWAEGTPVAMTEACNLGIGFEKRAAYRLAMPDSSEFSESLLRFLTLPASVLAEMRERGRELVASEFSWKQVAATMLGHYKRSLTRQQRSQS